MSHVYFCVLDAVNHQEASTTIRVSVSFVEALVADIEAANADHKNMTEICERQPAEIEGFIGCLTEQLSYASTNNETFDLSQLHKIVANGKGYYYPPGSNADCTVCFAATTEDVVNAYLENSGGIDYEDDFDDEYVKEEK